MVATKHSQCHFFCTRPVISKSIIYPSNTILFGDRHLLSREFHKDRDSKIHQKIHDDKFVQLLADTSLPAA